MRHSYVICYIHSYRLNTSLRDWNYISRTLFRNAGLQVAITMKEKCSNLFHNTILIIIAKSSSKTCP